MNTKSMTYRDLEETDFFQQFGALTGQPGIVPVFISRVTEKFVLDISPRKGGIMYILFPAHQNFKDPAATKEVLHSILSPMAKDAFDIKRDTEGDAVPAGHEFEVGNEPNECFVAVVDGLNETVEATEASLVDNVVEQLLAEIQ